MCTTKSICEATDRAIQRAIGVIDAEALASIALKAAQAAGDTDSSLKLVLVTHAQVVVAQRIAMYRTMPETAIVRILAQGLWPQPLELTDIGSWEELITHLVVQAQQVYPNHNVNKLTELAAAEVDRRFEEVLEAPSVATPAPQPAYTLC